MTEDQSNKLRIKIPKDYHASIKAQGAPWSIFSEREFDLNQAVSNITYHPDKSTPPTIIKKSEQIQDFMHVMETPYIKPYLYVISGRPDDTRACCIAAALMIQASIVHASMKSIKDETASQYKSLGRPRWVKLSNDFKDNLSGVQVKPSFLVISNITPMSSNHKFEKVRDLLEFHDNVPRIVVVNDIDPLEFTRSKIFSKPSYIMLLSQASKRHEV